MPTMVNNKKDKQLVSSNIEGDKIVCSWCGRYDDINETFDTLLKIMEWYNARTIVENNSWNFIQHVIHKHKQHLLVPSNQILFTKELNVNTMTFKEYGYSTTGQLFNNHLIPYLIDYVREVIGEEVDEDKNVMRKIFGVQRITDIMAIEEMKKFNELKNKDRLISLSALVAYVKVLTSNYGYVRVDKQDSDNNFETPKKSVNLNVRNLNYVKVNPYRSYFKNIKL